MQRDDSRGLLVEPELRLNSSRQYPFRLGSKLFEEDFDPSATEIFPYAKTIWGALLRYNRHVFILVEYS